MNTATVPEKKSLILIRHAKSSWENFDTPDFDRPLNDRGKKDGPEMADRMVKSGVKPDLLLVSTAKRTRKTASYFIDAWQLDKNQVRFLDPLYLASPTVLQQIIRDTEPSVGSLAIISHNNGLTDFANQLCEVRIDNIPTCGIFAVQTALGEWKNFDETPHEFWFFDYPKKVMS